MEMQPREYAVSPSKRSALVAFMEQALAECGARVIYASSSDRAPFRIVFVAPSGERMGICAYGFLANRRTTVNRPRDERRFQLKYGSKDGQLHYLWQDPTGLYTTLLVGIDPEDGFFVGADPVVHSPTKMYISIEFKDAHAEAAQSGWTVWERERRNRDALKEVLVGGNRRAFLQYVEFERAAVGLDQGHRMLLAQRLDLMPTRSGPVEGRASVAIPSATQLHILEEEFQLSSSAILDLVESAPRLKMAVRGWVAEDHLQKLLSSIPGVSDCSRIEEDGKPDMMLRYGGGKLLSIECKNVLRKPNASGIPRVDFQRTRAAKADPCSRYYRPEEFDLVAACLHPISQSWDFAFQLPVELKPHVKCEGRLASAVLVDGWFSSAPDALFAAGR